MTNQSDAFPTALEFDLAVSRLALAALRASKELEISEEARDTAGFVTSVIEQQLRALKGGPMISEKAIPDKTTRDELEHVLASMPVFREAYFKNDSVQMEELLPLLRNLQQNSIKGEQAKELLDALLRLSSNEEPTPQT